MLELVLQIVLVSAFICFVLRLAYTESATVLRHRLQKADRSLHQEAQRTRRAMNNAAGQSWRNLTD